MRGVPEPHLVCCAGTSSKNSIKMQRPVSEICCLSLQPCIKMCAADTRIYQEIRLSIGRMHQRRDAFNYNSA